MLFDRSIISCCSSCVQLYDGHYISRMSITLLSCVQVCMMAMHSAEAVNHQLLLLEHEHAVVSCALAVCMSMQLHHVHLVVSLMSFVLTHIV